MFSISSKTQNNGHKVEAAGIAKSPSSSLVVAWGQTALGVGDGDWEVEGWRKEQELADERWLSSRIFVNGWVWIICFLHIPGEGGTVTTAEDGEMLKELVSGDLWHLWSPVQRTACSSVLATWGLFCFHFACLLLFFKITNLAYSTLNSWMFFLISNMLTSLVRVSLRVQDGFACPALINFQLFFQPILLSLQVDEWKSQKEFLSSELEYTCPHSTK